MDFLLYEVSAQRGDAQAYRAIIDGTQTGQYLAALGDRKAATSKSGSPLEACMSSPGSSCSSSDEVRRLNIYIADAGIFMDRVSSETQRKNIDSLLEDESNIFIVPAAIQGEISARPSQVSRLNRPNVIRIQPGADPALPDGFPETGFGNFDRTDAILIQTAMVEGVTVLTTNAALVRQVANNGELHKFGYHPDNVSIKVVPQ